MAFLQDLALASNMLDRGLQEVGTLSAVREASAQVEAIKSQELDETGKQIDELEKRARTQQVANDLTQRLATLGVGGQQLATLVGTVGPGRPASGQERIALGIETGTQGLVRQGQQQLAAEQAGGIARDAAKIRQQAQFDLQKSRVERQIGAPLSDKQVETITNQESTIFNAQDLLERKIKTGVGGPVSSRLPDILDEDRAAFESDLGRFVLDYQRAISGAQVTDKEREFIQSNLPAATDREGIFKKKMNNLIRLQRKLRTRTLSNFRRAGKDISGFTQNQDPRVAGPSPAVQSFIRR